MKKRLMSCILTVLFLAGIFPVTVFASSAYTYGLKIQTRSESNGGTDSDIYGGFTYHSGSTYSKHMDEHGDDFEQGDNDYYGFSTDYGDPWMIKEVYLRNNGGDAWKPGTVEISLPTIANKTTASYVGKVTFTETLDNSSATRDCTSYTARKISSCGTYDAWGQSVYLNSSTTGTFSKTWDCNISDQYGTYNPWNYDDAPTLSCTVSNSAINGYAFTTGSTSGNAAFSFNYATINQQMIAANIGEVSFTVSLAFPTRSTNNTAPYSNTNTQTITVYRRCFDIGAQTISTSSVFNARTDYNYFNIEKRNVVITVEPTSIHCKTLTLTQKNTLASNFSGTAALYSGNTTATKLCDMTYSASNGVLTFLGTIPQNVSTNGNGVMLNLSNVSTINDGFTYNLNDGGTTKQFYFSNYKADTIAPTLSILNLNGTPATITDTLKNSHLFWLTASETLYPAKGVAHTPSNEATYNYSLYKYNDSSSTYSNDPTKITNYTGSGYYSTVTAPVSTGILTNTPINLKLYSREEGKYNLRIFGCDDADNTLYGNGSYYDIPNVLIDNQSPRVTVSETVENQAVDGTKSSLYTFNITDFASNYKSIGAYARSYYCFVPDGTSVPNPDLGNIQSGELESVIGKWAFVEGGASTTTAQLKVAKGGNFLGKLYYFTADSSGNDSRVDIGTYYTKDISVYNFDSRDTLITEPNSDYAKTSYTISFDDELGKIQTQYHWIAKDSGSTFVQNFLPYVSGINVGSATQTVADGSSVTLNGIYTLEYKATELTSGNYKVFTKDYSFDNAAPTLQFSWSSNNTKPSEYQQATIRITDASGLASASYQVVNPDKTAISGFEKTNLTLTPNTDNTLQVNETPRIVPTQSGAYVLAINAEDRNGQKVSQSAELPLMHFAIRNAKPTLVTVANDCSKKLNGTSITANDQYQLNIHVEEDMQNASDLSVKQVVKYKISTDGINYGPWKTAPGNLVASGNKLIQNFSIQKPVVLAEGNNTLSIKVACMSEGDAADPSGTLVSDAVTNKIIYDTTAPTYHIVYSTSTPTANDVTATITVSDVATATAETNLVCDNNTVSIEKTNDSTYILTIANNTDTVVRLSDMVGNEVEIPVKVSNIDKIAPDYTASVVQTASGERKDAVITVSVADRNPLTVRFALVKDPGSQGDKLEESMFTAFQNTATFATVAVNQNTPDGSYTTVYTIYARGLTGNYALGIDASDSLGNKVASILNSAQFVLEDAVPKITSIVSTPKITKSMTTTALSFNTKLSVLPPEQAIGATDNANLELVSALKNKEYVMSYNVICDNATERKLFVSDECGRAFVLTFTPDAQFVEGFKPTQTIYKNGTEIQNGTYIAFEDSDTIELVIEANSVYASQLFNLEQAVFSGLHGMRQNPSPPMAGIQSLYSMHYTINLR